MSAYIRVVDLETTGLTEQDHIIQIGWIDVHAETGVIHSDRCFTSFVNPGDVVIPPEASAVHHIIGSDLVGAPVLGDVVSPLAGPDVVALAAHNSKFEQMFIHNVLAFSPPWVCTYKCGLTEWPESPGHSNQTLRYYLGHNVDRTFADQSHRALPDAYVTAHHVSALIAKGYDVQRLVDISSRPALIPKCRFGKYQGCPWSEVDTPYLKWVLSKDFDENIMYTVQQELKRRGS